MDEKKPIPLRLPYDPPPPLPLHGPERPPARTTGFTLRLRPENLKALRAKAYSEGMLLTEWARFILLRELEPKHGK